MLNYVSRSLRCVGERKKKSLEALGSQHVGIHAVNIIEQRVRLSLQRWSCPSHMWNMVRISRRWLKLSFVEVV
jgi:hypothetical protein